MSEGSRDFGPFQLTWQSAVLSPGPTPLLRCELLVVGSLLWAVNLMPSAASRSFDARLDQYVASGTLTAGWLDPQAIHGQLLGSGCQFQAPTQDIKFDGTIGVW